MFSSPVALPLGSSGLVGKAVEVAVERLVLTSAGVLLAVVMAVALQRLDERDGRRGGLAAERA